MKLNYREYGQGEPVIILHGLLGMLDNWHSFAKKLAEDYWVITVDQRNHGKSEKSESFDYNLLSEDLYAFLDKMHIPRCHLIGHSMGGKTVMQFAHDYPAMVDKAVIVDIAPKDYSGGHEKIFEALLSIDLNEVDGRQEVQEALMEKLSDLSVVLFLMKNLSRNSDGTYRWKANIKALYDNYQKIIKNVALQHTVDLPCLFVKGEKSKYILPEEQNTILEWFPEAEIETVKGAGHWVHADDPDKLMELVKDHLNR